MAHFSKPPTKAENNIILASGVMLDLGALTTGLVYRLATCKRTNLMMDNVVEPMGVQSATANRQ